jgi:N-acetylneuraminic acid mutarotase
MKMDKQLVTIETESRDLEDIMLKEYPGKIFERNHVVSTISGKKVYSFLGLDKKEFENFISGYPDIYSYTISRFLGFPNEVEGLRAVSAN